MNLVNLESRSFINAIAPKDILASLYILEGQYLLRYHQDDQIFTKFISSEAVRNAFSQLPVDSGFFPNGIVRWGSTTKGTFIVKFIPPSSNNQLSFTGDSQNQILSIPLPGLVLMGIGRQYFLWAVKTKLFDPNAKGFHAPLPNINTSGGICFGNNPIPDASSESIEFVWELFGRSPFNGDSVAGKSKTFRSDIRKQLNYLHKYQKRSYPLRDLVDYPSRHKTIGEIIEFMVKQSYESTTFN
ncbi:MULTISPECIES: hypothetical protein [Aerosakkonema]|uniref:hypothetical protein n=1 Tax=Aerosakkonema TaxID=1246629 RepID=UPI0035B82754